MTTTQLRAQLDEVFNARERTNMAPTITVLLGLLKLHPDDAEVLYEVGGAYDTDGQEALAAEYYQRAIDAGLSGKWLRQCFLQFGSTMRNLERFEESLALFDAGLARYPGSESLAIFRVLTLHAMGKTDSALGTLIELLTDRLDTAEIRRYEAALRGNAEYLKSLDL